MLNNLLMATPWLARLNPEAYKLAGRGLYHAGNAHLAQQFLLKGQAHMPHDPETYHHLALIYWQQGDVATVRTLCQAVLLIVPTFWPAQQLLAQTQVASNAAST
jgi:Flp pilus assembly protein TadD